MPDVTISSLPLGTPSGTDNIPYSTGTETNRVAVQNLPVAYNSITGKPNLATVATTGNYNDLSNKPTIPSPVNSQQIAKAWVRFNGPGTNVPGYGGVDVSNLISASYNISSLWWFMQSSFGTQYSSRGYWRAYFTTPFANANHLVGTGSSSGNNLAFNLIAGVSFTTTYVDFYTPNGGNENVTSRLLPTGQTSFIVYSL